MPRTKASPSRRSLDAKRLAARAIERAQQAAKRSVIDYDWTGSADHWLRIAMVAKAQRLALVKAYLEIRRQRG